MAAAREPADRATATATANSAPLLLNGTGAGPGPGPGSGPGPGQGSPAAQTRNPQPADAPDDRKARQDELGLTLAQHHHHQQHQQQQQQQQQHQHHPPPHPHPHPHPHSHPHPLPLPPHPHHPLAHPHPHPHSLPLPLPHSHPHPHPLPLPHSHFPGKVPRAPQPQPPSPGGAPPPAPPPSAPPARFPSGQSISQPSGPTPTLNSLLAGGANARYPPPPPPQNPSPSPAAPLSVYDHQHHQQQQQSPQQQQQPPQQPSQPPQQQQQQQTGPPQQSQAGPPYHWPPRPLPPYPPQPYRPHPHPQGGGSRGSGQAYGGAGGGGGGYPSGGAPPAPYPPASHPPHAPPYAQQRYPAHPAHPAPPQQGLRPPYSPHQYEQGPSPQASPGGTPHSPGHAPSASPQPPHSPHAHQPYPPRPGQPSTPNAHDSESELTGQNSNDSSSGGGGGGPLVRPSPSPTGSSGSRSMSPAVGQQNIPMPPRPSSSSQAEGGGTGGAARAAGAPAAPLAAPPAAPPPQPGYHHPPPHQQHPPHPHQPPIGYKMPPHLQNYPPPHHYPQGNYSNRPPYPSQGYGPGGGAGGPGAGGPGAAAAGQYGGPGRPQGYPPYGTGWGGAGARPPPPPPHYLKQHLQHKLGPQHMGPPPSHHVMGPPGEPAQDNGLPGPPPAPATALVTTGPDGAPLDDGSQQSTLSNASAASGEEPACVTPRGGGRGPGGGAPSPGAASHASAHDDYDASPSSWPRTPSSPVFNSHVPQETYRTKKSDSLGKLYEMDESPERRGWVERLLSFMEERRTPIAACPTISKQPLDLYRLYLLVRDRGGFVEVTKNKTWKDIAGMLGIGASSSAAYTLRKHYTKNLLAFECHFDRGGIDPQPIINQVEATTKKKSNKNNSVPSPGSSNSQDSFPGPGSTAGAPAGPTMDGYGPPYSGYPPSSQPQQGGAPGDNIAASNPFEDPQPRHAAPPTPPAPHRNHQPGAYPGQQGYGGYDQYGSPYPPNRPVYPPYGPEQDNRSYPTGGGPASTDPYARYGGNYGGARGYPPPAGGAPGGPPPAPPQSPTPPPAASQDYYRPQGSAAPPPPPHLQQHEMSATVNMNSQLARQLVAPLSPGAKQSSPYLHGYGGNKAMPPPAGQPRRHPDFAKDAAPQPPYPPQRPQPPPHHQYGTWSNNSGGQYRGQFPPANTNAPPGNQWGGSPRPPPAPAPSAPWGQPYPQQGQQQWGSGMGGVAGAPGTPLRPGGAPPRPTGPYRPDLKQFPMPPTHQMPNKMGVPGVGGSAPKREISFPPDSVEAVTPVTFKRRRLTKNDVAPIEAWRVMMALKSGLLAETCWALDVLNILLFDDSSVSYFGLQHLPGLLDLLLEHFQKSLSDVFDSPNPNDDKPWYMPKCNEEKSLENNSTSRNSDSKQSFALIKGENFTHESRKGKPVIYKSKEDDIFAPDDHKEWDTEHEEVGIEPWQFGSDTSYINHVLPCFQSEFINIPFARVLERVERKIKKEEVVQCKIESVSDVKVEPTDCKDSQGVKKSNNSVSEKKTKRTKASLADVINRVKGQTSMNGENKINGENDLGTNDKSAETKLPVDIRQNGPAEESDCIEPPSKERTGSEDNFKSEPMEIEKDEKAAEKPIENKPNLKINDPAGILKRKHFSEYEDECYSRDEASLHLVTESQDSLARRCICLSNILRNLTFVPGNETEFSKSGTFLALMGKLLLLHHEHPVRAPRTRNYDREEDAEWKSSCSSLQIQEWWWDFLAQLREDALVCCANIGGQVDLGRHPEQVARPVLDGLLHWAVCPSAGAQDPLPALAPHRALSPRRLALEALCKLCVTDSNVDLVVATPPFPRLERLCSVLAKHLCRSEDQVLREFSVNLLHYLAAADSSMARTIAAQNPTVSLLVAFIEQAEQSALGVANQHGIGALRDNPDSMGTSLDMLRRAAGTLLHLAKHPDNKPLFIQQEQRLLSLVMSQILDQKVAAELSKVLFQCSRHPRHPTRSE